jgi:putative ABC transport system permease protein
VTRPGRSDREKLRSRLRGLDLAHLGTSGLRARPLRAVLSALGIAIGIAAMVAVVSISASSRQRLNDELASFGTNLLTAKTAEATLGGGPPPPLPSDVAGQVRRIDGVEDVSTTAALEGVHVYRSDQIEAGRSSGIEVEAAGDGLLEVVDADVIKGAWFNRATARYPTVVLGPEAAERLGEIVPGGLVWLGGREVTVIGILGPAALAPELDSAALVGAPFAEHALGFDRHPTVVYERSSDASVEGVRSLLAATIQPGMPSAVEVSRPSEVLAAKNAADDAFTGLLLALGSISLLVGGIGVANTMVISVLERRREIGVRRALGATRRHIWLQFLAEALLLATLGGAAGALLGTVATAGFAAANGWIPVVPAGILAVGVAATTVIGGIAGLYPAVRASRIPPTAALAG